MARCFVCAPTWRTLFFDCCAPPLPPTVIAASISLDCRSRRACRASLSALACAASMARSAWSAAASSQVLPSCFCNALTSAPNSSRLSSSFPPLVYRESTAFAAAASTPSPSAPSASLSSDASMSPEPSASNWLNTRSTASSSAASGAAGAGPADFPAASPSADSSTFVCASSRSSGSGSV